VRSSQNHDAERWRATVNEVQAAEKFADSQPADGQPVRLVKNRWRHLAVLTTALTTDSSEMSVVTALFPAIKASLGLSLTDLGLLSSSSKIAGAVFGPFWIWLARRWNRKAVIVVAAGLWGSWGIAAGFASGFGSLLLFYCVLAAGYAGAPPLITEAISDLFDDRTRGRAVGVMYGAVSLVLSVTGPLIGQLSGVEDGWRIGFWLVGGVNMLAGLLVLLLFEDPGLGATEIGPAQPSGQRPPRLTWDAAISVFRIPSFNLMLLSRLLSGHLTIGAFGVVFLVVVRHFPNKVAALVLGPFGVGYFLGTIGGAFVVDRLHVLHPRTGRVLFLQVAQLGFAIVAYFATQFDWGGIGIYMAFWLAMGFLQGVNPGVNRPIVMSVVSPELRAWAFVVMLTIIESIAWGMYNLGAGWFGDRYGLQQVFLVVLVGVMIVNALAITLLYRTYGPDVDRVQAELRRRALEHTAA
jgi:predicted MFS family arabinose efflux permease